MAAKTGTRQQIADSWPESIDDTQARKDWGWLPKYDLSSTVETMIEALKLMYPPAKEELKIID
jgi:threonine 3-dehydrogenase